MHGLTLKILTHNLITFYKCFGCAFDFVCCKVNTFGKFLYTISNSPNKTSQITLE